MHKVMALLGTVRAANFPTVVTNVVAAWWLAGGALQDGQRMPWWLVVGGLLIYAGGALLNDVIDVRFDRMNRPERAIPSGLLPLSLAWWLAGGMLVGGAGCVLVGGASWVATLLLCGTVVLYDLVHKKWRGAVILMALSRLLLWVVAASAVGLPAVVWLWAGLSAVFIVAISWIARVESDPDARAPILPRLLLLLPVAGVLVNFSAWASWLFGGLFVINVVWAWRLFEGKRSGRVKSGVEWLLATIPLLDAMAVASLFPQVSLEIATGCVLSHCLQRWFAAS